MSLRILLLGLLIASALVGHPPCPSAAAGVELFPLDAVELGQGPFLHSLHTNRARLMKFDPDRLLAPFLSEAGLPAKAEYYGSWEGSGLGGQTAGHYLSALAITAAALDDPECRLRLEYMVAELARCQQANGDGYVGGVPNGGRIWRQLKAGDIHADGFSLNGGWVPLYNLHKTFAGLRDAWRVGGSQQARAVLIGLAAWFADQFEALTDDQLQEILRCEHGGMNEVLADVAEMTGERRYLELAARFSHRVLLDPLAESRDRLDGMHANTQVPKVIGFERIAALGGDARFHDAAAFFWRTVVENRTIAIGGNSVAEHFPSARRAADFVTQREGPETCNTYNMLRLTEQLFQRQPSGRLADFYERALYNHILSSQHPEHGGYVYFTPARPGHYRVYSSPEECFWCCVGTGMENHSRHGTFIYAHDDESLLVNLFVASRVAWDQKGVVARQRTEFPRSPRSRIELQLEQPTSFTLRVRRPGWVSSGYSMQVNGEPVDVSDDSSGYVAIKRLWSDGDTVEVTLPMEVRAEPLPNLPDYVAFSQGPVVLAAELSHEGLEGLVAGEGRMEHVAMGPLTPADQAPVLVSEHEDLAALVEPVDGEPNTFTIAGAVVPDRFDGLRLVPFHRVHDARYMLYWQRTTPAQYEQLLAKRRAEAEAVAALERATLDQVTPGQQQPEVEHQFQGEQTSIGVWRDRSFRHAEGWFSYVLRTQGEGAAVLRVSYFGSDVREFDILIDGEVAAEVSLQAPKPDQFMDIDYPIPPELLEGRQEVRLTFRAKPGSMAGGIYGVRLMRSGGGD